MLVSGLLIVASAYICGHWMGAVATAALIAIWRIIPRYEGPPALALAMTTQWLQVTLGIYYRGLTGRSVSAFDRSEWEPMVLIALGALVAMSAGLSIGARFISKRFPARADAPVEVATFNTLLVVYAASVAATGVVQQLAWQFPLLTQGILALTSIRFALYYLVLRRLLFPELRWHLASAVIALEVGLGFTGFFAGFKEPLLLAGLALLEHFNPRRREHWVFGAGVLATLGLAVTMWMGVRAEFRSSFEDEVFAQDRGRRMQQLQVLTSDWLATTGEGGLESTLDVLVDRVWVIYYPALAVARVPDVIPHEDGALLKAAVVHVVTPRVLFPNKPELPNESEHVRKYTGLRVAGAERGTSIAFGYVAESYVDFGIPYMFIPPLVFGVLMGGAYLWFLRVINFRELGITLVTCVFWLNLYSFERSWARLLGLAFTMMAYLGGVVFLVDRWLVLRAEERAEQDAATRNPLFDGSHQ